MSSFDIFTSDRGTLGCGTYEAYVQDRGGTGQVELEWSTLDWERVVDDTSSANVTAQGEDAMAGCCEALSGVKPWKNELAIYRDGEPVWEGPIVRVQDDPDSFSVTISARDLSAWFDHRLVHNDHDYANIDSATVFQEIVEDAMAPDNSPGVTVTTSPTGVLTTLRVIALQHRMAGDVLRDLSNASIDWTVLVRRILAGGIVVPTASLGTLTAEDFLKRPAVVLDGTDQTNRRIVRGAGGGEAGDTIFGDATYTDPDSGLLESVETITTIENTAAAQATADGSVALLVAARAVGECTLAPTAPVTVEQLVAGALLDVVLDDLCIPVVDTLRIHRVGGRVTHPDGETIALDLQPIGASR